MEDLTLRADVQRHRMRYAVWTAKQVDPLSGDLIPVGFDVELFGHHLNEAHAPHPGCEACSPVKAALLRVARAVAEVQARPDTLREIDAFEPPTLTQNRHGQLWVPLRLELRHADNIHCEIDECERVCLANVTRALDELGVKRDRG